MTYRAGRGDGRAWHRRNVLIISVYPAARHMCQDLQKRVCESPCCHAIIACRFECSDPYELFNPLVEAYRDE